MTNPDKNNMPQDPFDRKTYGQIVLVFQGGGALGAYQAGVYQALHEAGVEPDWVIGTSIGAINAGLVAGNKPENRLSAMKEFWHRMRHNHLAQSLGTMPFIGAQMAHGLTMMSGVQNFFMPNPLAWMGLEAPLGAEKAAYYQTRPLESTLSDLIDLEQLNAGAPRLTVGAAEVQTGEMHYFDSRETPLNVKHIMASGALPPAFPAVRIDGKLFWDGGILSNTPVEAVFDDRPRRNGLVFAVHIWNPSGPEPDTIWSVMNRQKDLQYTSRAASHIKRQKQIHKLRHIIGELARRLPEDQAKDPEIRALTAYGCLTQMHVVRLLAKPIKNEDHLKDIDFSPSGIEARWSAGYEDTLAVIEKAPWTHTPPDPLEGFILHEAQAGEMMEVTDA